MKYFEYAALSFEVPDWGNYVAMDKNGVWYAYEKWPDLRTGLWDTKGVGDECKRIEELQKTKIKKWRESLIVIAQAEKIVIPEWEKL